MKILEIDFQNFINRSIVKDSPIEFVFMFD